MQTGGAGGERDHCPSFKRTFTFDHLSSDCRVRLLALRASTLTYFTYLITCNCCDGECQSTRRDLPLPKSGDHARLWEVQADHGRSREITGGTNNSREITGDHERSRKILRATHGRISEVLDLPISPNSKRSSVIRGHQR